jgi:hypothetical protein
MILLQSGNIATDMADTTITHHRKGSVSSSNGPVRLGEQGSAQLTVLGEDGYDRLR